MGLQYVIKQNTLIYTFSNTVSEMEGNVIPGSNLAWMYKVRMCKF